MIWVFEAAGMAALGGVIWILFRAAKERPDQGGLRTAAYIGLAAWIGYGILLLVDGGAFANPLGLARNALILAVILAVPFGYRRILGILRARAGDR